MDRDTWQALLSLESRDVTQRQFQKIHAKKLNARRAQEINAAARQAREYFTNAANASLSVRPLLTFYGVTSLSRALLLLFKIGSGEESLNMGHGIETVSWGDTMSGDTATGLRQLGDLKIRTRTGLFSDFVKYTRNRIAIHINSSGVDWRCNYDVPGIGDELSIEGLFSRIPDLHRDYSGTSDDASSLRYSRVGQLTYNGNDGLRMEVNRIAFGRFRTAYETRGYSVSDDEKVSTVTCSVATANEELPQFIHAYLSKGFANIPDLFVVEPFSRSRYSQLCVVYMVSYVLGMLVRYYPTHWIALMHGARGDLMWPTVNRAQQLVEHTYPDLVAEMITDAMATGHPF